MTSSSTSDVRPGLPTTGPYLNLSPIRLLLAFAALVSSAFYGYVTDWDATTPAIGAFFAAMAIATHIDLSERRVPNELVLVSTPLVVALFVVAAALDGADPLWDALIGAIALFTIFAIIHLISPDNFGAGDVKIAFLIGFATCWFGVDQISWFLAFVWIGLAAVAIVLRLHSSHRPMAVIAFVPILSLASVGAILTAAVQLD